MRYVTALALAAALLLAPPAGAQEKPPAPPPSAPTPEDDAKAIEALVRQASPLVEKARGLPFKAPVPAAPVTKEAFVEKYMRDFTRILGGEERVAPLSRLMTRLGIVAEGADFRALLGKFLEGNVSANYDPETGKVSFLPGAPRDLRLMVHELTHALDDQNFDMKAQMAGWGANLDRALAYGALAEGDAQSVEFRFLTGGGIARQPLEGLRTMAEGLANMIMQSRFGATPPAIVLAFKSQYTEGLVYAETLRRSEKGEEAVNAAFRAPPASTEQVLHPEKFLAGEAPVALSLPAPAGDAKTLAATPLGELCTRIVLLARGLDAKAAGDAAAGWGGDTVALVAFPGGEALLWTSAWDTEADATAFREAMEKAFPVKTGEESAKLTRLLVQRGTTVEFVEAPLDALPAATEMIKAAERK